MLNIHSARASTSGRSGLEHAVGRAAAAGIRRARRAVTAKNPFMPSRRLMAKSRARPETVTAAWRYALFAVISLLSPRRCALKISTLLLTASLVVLAASAHAQTIRRAPAFADDALVAPPTTNWATNGGDWYNRRYSPLTAIDRDNVATLKGVWRTHLRGSGLGPQYSGEAQPIVYRRRHLRRDRRERRVRRQRRQRRDPLGIPREPRSREQRRVLRLDEPRRRARRRQSLRRPARRQARRARSAHRPRRVVRASRTLARRLLDHERAALLRRTRLHGLRGRRARHSRPRESVRRARRQARVDVLHDPGPRRSRPRHVAARQRDLDGRRARPSGTRRPSIPSSGSSTSRPAIPAPTTTARSAAATTCSRRRSSPSMRRPASTAGTSKKCTTTSGTTTRPRP